MSFPNQLPAEFLTLSEMGTQSRGVSVLYGRRADGSLVALNVANDGTLASGGTFTGTVTLTGSSNSFFADQGTLPLTNAFQQLAFGFTSTSIGIFNDDTSTNTVEFSFNGVTPHGRLLAGEAFIMDQRAQLSIWVRAPLGAANYRVMVY